MMKNYKDLEEKGEDATKQVRDDFYKDFDVEYWFRKISECYKSYQKYKSPKYKARAVIEIYSIYIQLVEIFFINLNAVAGNKESFLPMLFVQNNEIRAFVKNIVDLNEMGAIKIDPWTQQTSEKGIWAAGDCTNVLYHQNNISAGDGVRAIEDIYLHLHTR